MFATSAFVRGLRHAMHAMAQPLTLLQSRSYLALARVEELSESGQILAAHAADLDHLCAIFRLVQQLIRVHEAPAQCSVQPCSAWTASLGLDAEAVLAGVPLELVFEIADCLPLVWMDPIRARQATRHMLSAARSAFASASGGRLACAVAARDSRVELSLGPGSGMSSGFTGNDAFELHLALAEANVVTQGGSFDFVPAPFRMTMALPLADECLTSDGLR